MRKLEKLWVNFNFWLIQNLLNSKWCSNLTSFNLRHKDLILEHPNESALKLQEQNDTNTQNTMLKYKVLQNHCDK